MTNLAISIKFIFAFLFGILFVATFGAIAELPQSDRANFPGALIGFTLAEFYSPNCRHCKGFSKTLRQLIKHVSENKEDFFNLKMEQFNCKGGQYCKKLGIKSMPTVRLYKNHELVGELRGDVKYPKLLTWLEGLINAHRPDGVVVGSAPGTTTTEVSKPTATPVVPTISSKPSTIVQSTPIASPTTDSASAKGSRVVAKAIFS